MYWKYFKYVLKHKYYVLRACFTQGLYWQGLIHDWSKFLPSEFIPYAKNFFRDNSGEALEAQSIYSLAEMAPFGFYTKDKFKLAFLHHIHFNKHHWQHWILYDDVPGEGICLPMPEKYVKEMVCDWCGAGAAIKKIVPDPKNPFEETRKWYNLNRGIILLHPETRKNVEALLEITQRN